MRVILDACVPERLARYTSGHEVTTIRAVLGTTSLDDGPLLDALAPLCDAFLTVDKNLRINRIFARVHSGSYCSARTRTQSSIWFPSCLRC